MRTPALIHSTLIATLLLAAVAFSGDVAESHAAVCSPMLDDWMNRDPFRRAVSVTAIGEWQEFTLDDLPFLGPFEPASVETIRLLSPGAATFYWLRSENGDSVKVMQPAEAFFPGPSTPTLYRAHAFTVGQQGNGPGTNLGPADTLWVVATFHGTDCRRGPRIVDEWILEGSRAGFLFEVDDVNRSTTGSFVAFQWTFRGPYPFGRQFNYRDNADPLGRDVDRMFGIHAPPSEGESVP